MEQLQKPHPTYQRVLVFTLTFVCYVGLHSIRTAWAYSKSQISQSTSIQNTFFGICDAVFLLSYSFGLTILSSLINRVPINWFLGAGMILSSISFFGIAVEYYISSNLNQGLMIGSMILNGFFQGVGWPGMMTVMANWFGKQKRGILFAFWSVNASVGNVVGLVGCSIIEFKLHQPWTSNFVFVSSLTVIIAILIIIFLKPKPDTEGSDEKANQNLITQTYRRREIPSNTEQRDESKPSINIFSAFMIPRVPYYVVSYAMIKSCMNGLLFWLPTYLTNKDLGSQKAYISSMSDVGTFVGGIVVGYLGDRFVKRALFLSPLLFVGSLFMLIVWKALQDNGLPYYFLIFGIGFLVGGPYRIIGSAIAIDLGQHQSLKNQEKGVSVVSGLIQGCAAIMSSITLFMIPLINLNWLFLIFFVECLVAASMLSPLFLKDFRILQGERREGREMKEIELTEVKPIDLTSI